MRLKNYKAINKFLGILGFFSLALVLAGEWSAAGALWMVAVCLLPAVWLSLGTSYLGLKIYCVTVLITQTVTLPAFYLRPDRYAFDDYRPFGFASLDALQAFLILGLFLLLVACLVKLIELAFDSPVKIEVINLNTMQSYDTTESGRSRGSSSTHAPTHSAWLAISILLLIVISLPIKSWMFDMGIGLVGTPPPQLPYRLSGILFYSFNYLVPVALAYFYIKTKRNSLLLALIVSVYAVIIGLLSLSKSVVLLPIAPIVAFAWMDRRWVILTFSTLLAGFGVTMVVLARGIVHFHDGNSIGAFTELGVLGTLSESLARFSWSPELLMVAVDIANRFEGFQSTFLASQFNADAVDGTWNMFLTVVSFGQWGGFDHDAIHLEYLGYTIPSGLYGVGASFNSYMMMAVNNDILMVLPFATYAAITLIILERSVMNASRKYQLPQAIAQSGLFFSVMFFFTGPATSIFGLILVASVSLSLLPALVLRIKFKYGG